MDADSLKRRLQVTEDSDSATEVEGSPSPTEQSNVRSVRELPKMVDVAVQTVMSGIEIQQRYDVKDTDQSCSTKRLHSSEDSDSSSDKDSCPIPTKQRDTRSVEKLADVPSLIPADVSTKTVMPDKEGRQGDDGKDTDQKSSKKRLHTKEDSDSSSDIEFCPRTTKRPHLHIEEKLETLDEKAKIEVPEERQHADDSFADKAQPNSEVASQSPERASVETPGTSASIQEPKTDADDKETFKYLIEMTAEEKLSAQALELAYIDRYGTYYSKELLFAVDVTLLMRLLRGLEIRYIIFVTSGEPPTSPCNDTMDDALAKMWRESKDGFEATFTLCLHSKGINYKMFQEIALVLAEKNESRPFEERSFLMYCLTIAQWAAFAEINGVPDARSFAPLVLCRTIKKLKSLGKISADFWEKLAKTASDICSEE